MFRASRLLPSPMTPPAPVFARNDARLPVIKSPDGPGNPAGADDAGRARRDGGADRGGRAAGPGGRAPLRARALPAARRGAVRLRDLPARPLARDGGAGAL